MEFFSEGFEKEVENVVKDVFPMLNINHQNLLIEYLKDIIEIIAIKFNFDKSIRIDYEKQFRQNNYRDVQGLLLLLH